MLLASQYSGQITCVTLKPGSVDGTPSHDASIWSNSPSSNYGHDQGLDIMAWTWSSAPGIRRGLIEFPLHIVPSGVFIQSAELSLYFNPISGSIPWTGGHSSMSGPNDAQLFRIVDPWDANTVTWYTQPNTTTLNQVALAQSTTSYQDYLNIDVTNMTIDMINNPSTSYGFMLRLSNELYYRAMLFASGDHPTQALHPELKVCYSQHISTITLDKTNDRILSVYPNPNSGKFTLELSESFRHGNVQVVNLTGSVVAQKTLRSNREVLDISDVPPGVYVLKVFTERNRCQERIIKR